MSAAQAAAAAAAKSAAKSSGLTKREEIALAILASFAAVEGPSNFEEDRARIAFRWADAFLRVSAGG